MYISLESQSSRLFSNRCYSQSADNTQFFEIAYGPGFNLQVTAFILLGLNAFLCKMNSKARSRELLRMRQSPIRERLNTSNLGPNLDDDKYVSTEVTTSTGGGLGRQATRRKQDDVAPGVIVMSSTTGL